MKTKTLTITILAALLLARCTVNPVAGGGSEVTNGVCAFNGRPAPGTEITAYPSDYIPTVSKEQPLSVTADSQGNFSINLDSVRSDSTDTTGSFNLFFINHARGIGAVIHHLSHDSILGAVELAALGAIQGAIRIDSGDGALTYIPGSPFGCASNSPVGNFTIDSIPAGQYEVSAVPVFLESTSCQSCTTGNTAAAVLSINGIRYLLFTNHLQYQLPQVTVPQGGVSSVVIGLLRPMVMKNIAAGTFTMGSLDSLDNQYSSAAPPHQVTLSAFTMQETDVTQEQYRAVTGVSESDTNSSPDSILNPVVGVSWFDAVLYCNALSKLSGIDTCYTYTQPGAADAVCDFTKHGYRLPTEAEWEYACRAATTTDYYWGDDTTAATIDQYAWYNSNAPNGPQPVATKLPNAWGLYDMCGNVNQWCYDWYGDYASSAAADPAGPATGSYRVMRGGAWNDPDVSMRSASRNYNVPGNRDIDMGFRCVRQ